MVAPGWRREVDRLRSREVTSEEGGSDSKSSRSGDGLGDGDLEVKRHSVSDGTRAKEKGAGTDSVFKKRQRRGSVRERRRLLGEVSATRRDTDSVQTRLRGPNSLLN